MTTHNDSPEKVLERARKAFERHAHDEASSLCKEVLSLVDKKLKGTEASKTRASALLLLADIEDVKGSWVSTILYLDGVVQIAVSSNDSKLEVEALLRAGNALVKKGKWDDGLKKFDRAAEVSSKHGNSRMTGRALVGKGKALWRMGKLMEALQFAKRAREYGEKAKDDETLAGALTIVSNVKFDQGEYMASIEADKEALKVFQKTANPFEIARVLNNIGETFKAQAKWAEAIEYFRKSCEVATTSGNYRTMGYALANLAECRVRTGDLKGAAESAMQAQEAIAKTEDKYAASNIDMIFGMISAEHGNVDETHRRFGAALKQMTGMGIPYDTGIIHLEYGRALAKFREKDEARKHLKLALEALKEAGAKAMIEAAERELATLK